MRPASIELLFLLLVAYPLSQGQPVPGGRGMGGPGLPDGPGNPPTVTVRPELPPPSAEAIHKELLSDLKELIAESQALQQELQATHGATVSVQSFKRSQKIENLSKKIRKTLKQN